MKQLRGLVSALVTPFDERGSPDTEALARLVDFQLKNGADALFVCGSTGLGPMLLPEERKAIVESVLRSTKGRVPVVAQVGASDTRTSVDLAEHAVRTGVDVVACLTPYYYKADSTSIRFHYKEVSSAAKSPIVAYNIPKFTGNNLVPELVAELREEGLLTGVKDSSGDFTQLVRLRESLPEDFTILNGTENFALSSLQLGVNGLVSGTASAFPELMSSLTRAFFAGGLGDARRVQAKISRLKRLTEKAPLGSLYEVLKEKGVPCGLPRPPIRRLATDERRSLVSSLRDEGLLSA